MRIAAALGVVVMHSILGAANAQEGEKSDVQDQDLKAITQTALDYIDGWYTGDATRMERAVHPELAKRIVRVDAATGQGRLDHMGAMTLVQRTRSGIGTKTPVERRQEDVVILDRFENAAVVRVTAADWIDYLQVAKLNGEWKIVNVLWEMKPETKKD